MKLTLELFTYNFQFYRNLICVYSKKHMLDDPELVEMKRKANTRSLKEMATLLRYIYWFVAKWLLFFIDSNSDRNASIQVHVF